MSGEESEDKWISPEAVRQAGRIIQGISRDGSIEGLEKRGIALHGGQNDRQPWPRRSHVEEGEAIDLRNYWLNMEKESEE